MRKICLVISVLFLASCASDNLSEVLPRDVKTPLNSTDSVFYQAKIQNLMAVYCVDCHNPHNMKEGVNLDNYDDVKKNAEKSYQAMLSGEMPEGGAKLDAETLNSMKRWIELGKPYGQAPISYNRDIKPLIELECGSCHISTISGGVSLSNYDEVKSVALDGRLLGTLTENGFTLMPPSGPLPNNQIDLVRNWINSNYAQ